MAQERSELAQPEVPELSENEDIAAVPDPEIDLKTADEEISDETQKIKAQIEETRAEMGETIDAIQEKLSFSNISGQVSEHVNHAVETAKGAVYDATIGKAVTIMKNLGNEISTTSIGRTVKNNPVPFLLIGAGAGLLAYQSFSGNGPGRRSGRRLAAGGAEQEFVNGRDNAESGPLNAVSEAITGVKDTVSSAAGVAYEKVSGAVDQVYSKAGEYGSTARDQYDHYLEENPLAVGAVALALGAAVGLAIPATRYEGQLMGQARQDLLDKAQETASNLLHETKQTSRRSRAGVFE